MTDTPASRHPLPPFDDLGYMRHREASINDVPIAEHERRIDGPRIDGDTSGIPLH